MARWVFMNSLSPLGTETKYWYWIHVLGDLTEERGGPFPTLRDCIDDARSHGLPDASVSLEG